MVTTTMDISVTNYRNRVLIRYYSDDAENYWGPLQMNRIGEYHLPEAVRGVAFAYFQIHDSGFEVDVEPIERSEQRL